MNLTNLLNAIGLYTKSQIDIVKNELTEVCNWNDKLEQDKEKMKDDISILKETNNQLTNEYNDLKEKLTFIPNETFVPENGLAIYLKDIMAIPGRFSHVGYDDGGRTYYSRVFLNFYNVNDTKIDYILQFNSHNKFTVNDKEFEFGKSKDMWELVNSLVENKQLCVIKQIN